MKLKSNKKEGVIVLSNLSGEEFFALMDEIHETMDMFKRWDRNFLKVSSKDGGK